MPAAAPLPILTPLRLTRNLLLVLITPREWIGRNIRQIGSSSIFYLHIPVTASQSQFLSLASHLLQGSWGCAAPLGHCPRLRAWLLPPDLREALQDWWAEHPGVEGHVFLSAPRSVPCARLHISALAPVCGPHRRELHGNKLLWVPASRPFKNFLLKYIYIRKVCISEHWFVCFHSKHSWWRNDPEACPLPNSPLYYGPVLEII